MIKSKITKTDNIMPTLVNLIWPGIGQILQGRIGLGVGTMVTYAASWILCCVLIGFIMVPCVWIWALYDAYNYEG